MEGWYLEIFSAFWLGILTSISPCPLATNVAAMSFVARNLGSSRKILWSGLFYSAGRMLVYIALAVLEVWDEIASIETVKVNLSLPSPVKGTIIEVNSMLQESPELINHDPYGEG
jgi:cytochrome c-type biogenesis protein